ncbi:hypothetical protein [Vogesella indigofera]|uniref:hypothetical protein n=1 Tax=Vogesella indigofera TaxID=45465 RepID=UPI003F42CE09
MKILIIEDEFDKREKIKGHLVEILGDQLFVVERDSLRSAFKAIVTEPDYDLILLDMSMPSFDVTSDEPAGGPPESFAGREIMAQMKLRGINIPVVVITQYKLFEGGEVSLDELILQFETKFSDFFQGAIYYNSAIEGWKRELKQKVDAMIKK